MDFENILAEIDYYDVFDYYDEIFWSFHSPLEKSYLRDATNPFELPQENFKERFRFSQDSVMYIVSLIRKMLEETNNRDLSIGPEISVLITLRFYATASFHIVRKDFNHISQPSLSQTVPKVTKLLAQMHSTFIKVPQGHQVVTNRELFKEMGRHEGWPGLPDVEGAVDCTHVKIVNKPGHHHHEAYRNGESYFSINTQVVVGPRTEFLHVVARWAGGTHKSRIFKMSSVYTKYGQGGKLVADTSYPTLPFVLTPVTQIPQDPASQRYNRAHRKTWSIVERTIGLWKRRFPCLSNGLGHKLPTVSNIIVACAVLHNLSLILKDDIPLDVHVSPQYHEEGATVSLVPSTEPGFAVRNSIIDMYFT